MTPEEIERHEKLLKIIDGLWRRSIYDQSWIGALLEKVVELEAERGERSRDEARAVLRERQKKYFQRLLEKLESRDPGLAAQIDDRTLEDIL